MWMPVGKWQAKSVRTMNGQFSRTNEDRTWNQQSTVTCQTDFMAHALILLIIDARPFRHCQVARPSCSKLFLPGGVCKMRHVSNVQDAWQIFIPRPSDVAMGDWKHHPAATVKDSDPRSSNSHKKTWFEPLWGAPRCQHWSENRPKSPESFSWNERQTKSWGWKHHGLNSSSFRTNRPKLQSMDDWKSCGQFTHWNWMDIPWQGSSLRGSEGNPGELSLYKSSGGSEIPILWQCLSPLWWLICQYRRFVTFLNYIPFLCHFHVVRYVFRCWFLLASHDVPAVLVRGSWPHCRGWTSALHVSSWTYSNQCCGASFPILS